MKGSFSWCNCDLGDAKTSPSGGEWGIESCLWFIWKQMRRKWTIVVAWQLVWGGYRWVDYKARYHDRRFGHKVFLNVRSLPG